MRLCFRVMSLLVALSFLGARAEAAVFISEIFSNPPGNDNGAEFFELGSTTPSESMNGLTLLVIEGDGTNAGIVDQAFNLNGLSTGSNGLFLRRDSATVLLPPPAVETTLAVGDFVPDLENGTNTWALVNAFTGAVGDDLDTDNDGTLNVTPWSSVLDSLSIVEDDLDNFAYADELGGVVFPQQEFSPDAAVRGPNGIWYAMDVLGSVPGPFTFDPLEIQDQFGNLLSVVGEMTPGSANMIPEPTSGLLVLATACIALGLRRRA